jgi:hypothetical protein
MKALLDQLWNKLQEMVAIVPSLLTALAIFIVGWILARIIRRILREMLAKTGVDRLADRLNRIDIVANTKVEIVPSRLFSKIIYYIVLLIFIMASVEALGMEAVSNLMTDIINYLPKALSAFIVLIVGILLADTIKNIVQTTCESLAIPAARLIANVVFYFLFLNVALITLKQADLQTSFMETNLSILLAGVIGAFAIGYGLASRSLMANMISSFYNKDKIHLGDEISIEGMRGTITHIDGTTVTLVAEEGEVVVPLSKFSTETYRIHRRAPQGATTKGADE